MTTSRVPTPSRILPALLLGATLLAAGACGDDEARPDAAAVATDAGPDPAPDATASDGGVCPAGDASYTACGCGCCPGVPASMRCLDVAQGETFESVEAADRAAAGSPGCAMTGCSAPIVYVCCP